MIAFLISLGPNLPGLINAVGSTTGGSHGHITDGAKHIYTFDWLFGFVMSVFVYTVLSLLFPERGALVVETIRTLEVIHSETEITVEGEKNMSVGATSLESKSLS